MLTASENVCPTSTLRLIFDVGACAGNCCLSSVFLSAPRPPARFAGCACVYEQVRLGFEFGKRKGSRYAMRVERMTRRCNETFRCTRALPLFYGAVGDDRRLDE